MTITMEGKSPVRSRQSVEGRAIHWRGGKTTVAPGGEDVVLIQID